MDLEGRLAILNRLLVLLLSISFARAEDLYIAQSSAGYDNGNSCADAHGAAWFNTSANWGGGTGEIDPGDTVHLCGTISTTLTFQTSGTPGNAITLVFENGASMSAGHWGSPGRAIYASNKNYITIDGGTNGVIEATDNGTGLGFQDVNTYGVELASASNIEIKNLTIRGIFVRTPMTNGAYGGNGIRLSGVLTNANVHHNSIRDSNASILVSYDNASSDISIHNNNATHARAGIFVGNNGAAQVAGVYIYGNTINVYDDTSDSTCSNLFHADGIQVFAQTAGSNISNLQIFNNTVGPEMGECAVKTAWVFLEGLITTPLVYNNILTLRSGVTAPTNGFIYDKPQSGISRGTSIYNNTIVSVAGAGTGISAEEDGSIVNNNILVNLNYALYGSGHIDSDNNLYYGNATNGDAGGSNVFADPLLTVGYRISTGSSPAIGAGKNLTSLGIVPLNSDAAGYTRPALGGWDIGAYQFLTGHSVSGPITRGGPVAIR